MDLAGIAIALVAVAFLAVFVYGVIKVADA